MILKRDEGIFIAGNVAPAAGFRTAWTGNSIIPIMQGLRQKLTVSSTSANDTFTGTGAREVRIEGLDDRLNPIEIVAILNGQTAVELEDVFAHVNYAYVIAAGSTGYNEGIIHVGVGTVAAGVPATSYEQIAIRDSVAHTVRYVVPTQKRLYIKRIGMSRLSDKSFLVDVKKYYNGVWQILDSFAFHTGDLCHIYDTPIVIFSGEAFAVEISSDKGTGEQVYVKVFGEEK
jgi:hypothetical protein